MVTKQIQLERKVNLTGELMLDSEDNFRPGEWGMKIISQQYRDVIYGNRDYLYFNDYNSGRALLAKRMPYLVVLDIENPHEDDDIEATVEEIIANFELVYKVEIAFWDGEVRIWFDQALEGGPDHVGTWDERNYFEADHLNFNPSKSKPVPIGSVP